jgi:hypothetical protein
VTKPTSDSATGPSRLAGRPSTTTSSDQRNPMQERACSRKTSTMTPRLWFPAALQDSSRASSRLPCRHVLQQAAAPCPVAYSCVRIRRLVRLSGRL